MYNYSTVAYLQPIGVATQTATSTTAVEFNGEGKTYICHNTGIVDISMTFSSGGGGAATTATASNGLILRVDERIVLQINRASLYSAAAGELTTIENIDG